MSSDRPLGRPVLVPADDADAVYEAFRLSIDRAKRYLPVHRVPAKGGKCKYIFVVTECEEFVRQLPMEPILLPPER